MFMGNNMWLILILVLLFCGSGNTMGGCGCNNCGCNSCGSDCGCDG